MGKGIWIIDKNNKQISECEIQKINKVGKPAIIYFHPWELDSSLPRKKVNMVSRLRYYGNLTLTERKIKVLLGDFEFTPVKEVLEERDHTS